MTVLAVTELFLFIYFLLDERRFCLVQHLLSVVLIPHISFSIANVCSSMAGLIGGAALAYGASKIGGGLFGHGLMGWGRRGSWSSLSSMGSFGSVGSFGSFG